MAYISTAYSVGNIVFVYRPERDSVQRMRILSMHAKCTAGSGLSSDWEVTYYAEPAMASRPSPVNTEEFSESQLYSRPEYAFPAIVHAVVQLPEMEAA